MSFYEENAFNIKSLKNNHQKRDEIKKSFDDYNKRVDKIIKYAKIIKYPEYKEAYDYVDSLFKTSNVKEMDIYIVPQKEMIKNGFDGQYGFFFIPRKMIFIRSSMKQHKIDEVIVHELIHYVYNKEELFFRSLEINEEVAYGWSIGYFRQKGYSEDYIINKVLMEFYMNFMIDKSIMKFLSMDIDIKNRYEKSNSNTKRKIIKNNYKKIESINKELAFEKSVNLFKRYEENLKNGTKFSNSENKETVSRFESIDFDF